MRAYKHTAYIISLYYFSVPNTVIGIYLVEVKKIANYN